MPEITDAELAEFKAAKESAAKLEEKNKELLNEKKAEKEKRELADKLAADKELEVLKEKVEYKALAEKFENDKKERDERDKATNAKLEKGAKLTKVQEELGKIGIDPTSVSHALKLIELDEVKYDPTSGAVFNADVVASKLKIALPALFVKKDKEGISHEQSQHIEPGSMTIEWFNSLSAADQNKHHGAFMKAQGYK